MWIIEMIQLNPIWQIFWFAAMFTAFIWLLQKNDRSIVKIVIISSIFWIFHYYFMWIYSAMALWFVWLARLSLSLRYKKNKKVFYWVLFSALVIWLMTYESKLSILPIIGTSISAYWYFFCEWLRLRLVIFFSSIFWLSFNINVGSLWGTLNEIISQCILIFIMYTLIRQDDNKIVIIEKIKSFFKRKIPDVERNIIIFDYIRNYKESLKDKILSKFSEIKRKIINKPKKWKVFTKSAIKKVKL